MSDDKVLAKPTTQKDALRISLFGIAFQLVGNVLAGAFDMKSAGLIISFGILINIWGCVGIARLKGRHWAFGLLGFFSFVGLAIVWYVLDDRRRDAAAPTGP